MNKETTAVRLQMLMAQRKLRQVDILELAKPFCQKYEVKLNKSDLSQYVSGKVEPGQDKLYVLGLALNVSEAWLMGYDVPMEKQDVGVRPSNTISPIRDGSPIHLSISDTDPQIDAILRNARKLNAQGLERLEAYSDDLAGNPKYLKQKAPLTIAARGGNVMDTSQIDIEALKRGLKELDAEDNL